MTRARRDEADDDEAVALPPGEDDERAGRAVAAAAQAAGIEPKAPADPESVVQLRWVYAPGITRLEIKQGSDPWTVVPSYRFDEVPDDPDA